MPLRDHQLAETASWFELAFPHLGTQTQAAFAKACEWASMDGKYLVYPGHPHYPVLLAAIDSPPKLLFVQGQIAALHVPLLGVVGSRRASPQGLQIARQFTEELALLGLGIVSGLALGIDAAAHAGALKSLTPLATVAVIGTGINETYPKQNGKLRDAILERGCVVSEFPLGTPALAQHFPRRNRVIAGLSSGVWVVEAAMKSGSLITARQALDYGRDVFATPGSIFSSQSKGCHWLIKQGAKLVEEVGDILLEINQTSLSVTSATSTTCEISQSALKEAAIRGQSNDVQCELLERVGWGPWWPESLASELGVTQPYLLQLLLEWELSGHISHNAEGQVLRV